MVFKLFYSFNAGAFKQ